VSGRHGRLAPNGQGVAETHLYVAIVNYNSAAQVEKLIWALADEEPDRIVVVDNASAAADGALLREVEREHDAVLIEWSPVNAGFGAGVNRGIELLAPAPEDVVWIVNPDIHPEPGAARALAEVVARGDADIVSPLILRADDMRVWYAGGRIDWRLGRTVHDAWGRPAEEVGADLVSTAFMCGAAPMMSGRTWQVLGGFREDFFLYWEDADLSVRAFHEGVRMFVDCATRVVHDEGGASEGTGRGLVYYEWGARNRVKFLNEWAPAFSWRQRAIRQLEPVRMVKRALSEPEQRMAKAAAVLRANKSERGERLG
jgi:N-acetylglucosaminyl-diphospho-decaprenol L-rhamnosyltransferase